MLLLLVIVFLVVVVVVAAATAAIVVIADIGQQFVGLANLLLFLLLPLFVLCNFSHRCLYTATIV